MSVTLAQQPAVSRPVVIGEGLRLVVAIVPSFIQAVAISCVAPDSVVAVKNILREGSPLLRARGRRFLHHHDAVPDFEPGGGRR